jgi:flagellar protein FlgJ
MILSSTPAVMSAAPAEALSPERMELREAAQAFEAIFLRQLLASARASDFGGDDIFSGQGLEQFEAMRDEHFAELSSTGKGGLGLARSIEEQLAAHMSATSQTQSEEA